jgi:hypothetical protein
MSHTPASIERPLSAPATHGGALLLEGKLGMGVHRVRQLDERGPAAVTSRCATALTSMART